MASGIATSQGWTPPMVAGLSKVPVQDNTFLWNQLSLTSTTGDFAGQNSTKASFGKRKINSKLSSDNKDIRYLKFV